MPANRRTTTARAVTLAGLLAVSPVLAGCGGSSGGSGAASSAVSAVKSAVPSSASSAASSVTSAAKSVASSAASAAKSAGVISPGQSVNLTGTVAQVIIPGHVLLLMAQGSTSPVPVASMQNFPAGVTKGTEVTVMGTGASVDLSTLAKSFNIPAAAQAKLQAFNGKTIVNATSVTVKGSAAGTPAPSTSS